MSLLLHIIDFRQKFTRNSSITPFKGYIPNSSKLISKYKSQKFPSSRKATIFCKKLRKINKQPRNFKTGGWSKNRIHFGNISGKSSTSSKNVSTGTLAGDKGGGNYVEEGAIQKASVEKGQFLRNLISQQTFEKLKNLNALISYLHFKMEGLHLLKDMLKEKD